MFFLQVLGVIFLIILCVLAYYFWKIRRFFKAHANSNLSVAMTLLPALGLDLEDSSHEQWREREQLDFLESQLKRIGANHLGYFCLYHGNAEILVSMWNIKHQAVAFIYEGHSGIKGDASAFFFEVSCKLKTGSLTITSNPHAIYDSRPEQHRIVFNEANSIGDFIKALKTEIPAGEQPVVIKDPTQFSQDAYEEIAEWAWRPEQLKSEKTQQVFAAAGLKIDDELMNELIDTGRSFAIDISIERTKRKLTKHSKMSAERWERIRNELVIVSEHMQPDHLIEAIHDLAGDLSDVQQQVLDGFDANTKTLNDPLGAFQMLLSSLNIKAKRIATMEALGKTEVYLPLRISD
jgi:hypothetical protein